MEAKQPEDGEKLFKILKKEDPYEPLRSIHNGVEWYNYANPAVTHLSIQCDPWEDGGVGGYYSKIDRWLEKYGKPVIIDEMKYEGNIIESFGRRQPAERVILLPDDKKYNIEVIDTWSMTIKKLDGSFSGECIVPLPGKPFIALRARVNSLQLK